MLVIKDAYHRETLTEWPVRLSLNVRSLRNKIDELRTIIHNTKAAVVGISESWVDHSTFTHEELMNSARFEMTETERVVVYALLNAITIFAFRNREDWNHESLEATWFELLMPKSKPITIGTVYRPPEQDSFVENFEEVLSKIRSDIEVIILGVFNICVKKEPIHYITNILKFCNCSASDKLSLISRASLINPLPLWIIFSVIQIQPAKFLNPVSFP